ncbi:ABC transporter permease [Nocardioides yefusunii]|uniref:ABC transporter permease n=1 Tax=Nocardioides yefusunii TaxID=2500546 RepID=A0ABW1QX66_9ACTN|nr:ABC transporter permease [Nocardioides yefusunii]
MNAVAARTVGLARFNLTLMLRNRTTMIYGVVIPLLPLALLFTLESDAPDAGASMITTAWLMALIFPGYYNLLSMFVSRRDELVLKRLRTGEIRDGELITSMALPGALLAVLVLVLAVPITAVAGVDLPVNPVMLLVAVVLSVVTFAAFALWTASWTKTAEAAQLTSAPVMVLAMVGTFAPIVPESVGRWLDLTPGAAVGELASVTWFGLESGAETATLSFVETFSAALPALGVLVAWTALAVLLARRSLRWEPRA